MWEGARGRRYRTWARRPALLKPYERRTAGGGRAISQSTDRHRARRLCLLRRTYTGYPFNNTIQWTDCVKTPVY
ncbi:unnamed protein product [Leptosia nina]|uniref:Uncharacterized protein n=1 Tax=Leptosia nina TaxID=320188 RepID=A0AAV1JJD5_9NEOP